MFVFLCTGRHEKLEHAKRAAHSWSTKPMASKYSGKLVPRSSSTCRSRSTSPGVRRQLMALSSITYASRTWKDRQKDGLEGNELQCITACLLRDHVRRS